MPAVEEDGLLPELLESSEPPELLESSGRWELSFGSLSPGFSGGGVQSFNEPSALNDGWHPSSGMQLASVAAVPGTYVYPSSHEPPPNLLNVGSGVMSGCDVFWLHAAASAKQATINKLISFILTSSFACRVAVGTFSYDLCQSCFCFGGFLSVLYQRRGKSKETDVYLVESRPNRCNCT